MDVTDRCHFRALHGADEEINVSQVAPDGVPEKMRAVICHGPEDYRLEEVAVPVPGPGRGELGPERDDRKHRQALHPLDHPANQLECGRVGPVQVLVEGQHRLARR